MDQMTCVAAPDRLRLSADQFLGDRNRWAIQPRNERADSVAHAPEQPGVVDATAGDLFGRQPRQITCKRCLAVTMVMLGL